MIREINPNQLFQPEWPKSLEETNAMRVARIAYDIFSVIIFPVGLVRLVGYLISKIITLIIIPASMIRDAEDLELDRSCLLVHSIGNKSGEEIFVKTPDNEQLNGAIFPGKDKEKYILFCNPNACSYEQIGWQFLNIAESVGCSALVFNPRGVVKSEGTPTSEGLALDVYTMFEYLVAQGIKPENIVIYGFSLGGAYGSMGAELVQEKYPEEKINICNERSFADLATEAYALVRNLVYVPVIAQMAGAIAYLTIRAVGWQMDAKASFDSLTGKKLVIYHKNDAVIPFDASLHNSVKNDLKNGVRTDEITRIKLRDKWRFDSRGNVMEVHRDYRNACYHTRPFEMKEDSLITEELKSMLNIVQEEGIVEGESPIRRKLKEHYDQKMGH